MVWTLKDGADHDKRISNEPLTDMVRETRAFEAYLEGKYTEPIPKAPEPESPATDVRQMGVETVHKDRCLYTTEKGLLGQGRDLTQAGDQIVIFFGGKMPFILRPINGLWRLVGPAWMYGFMMGEAVEGWKQGKYATKDFIIF